MGIRCVQKHRILNVLLVCILCTACSDSIQLNALSADDTVLAFGDSLTFGSGAGSQQSYPAQLEQLINRKIINAGVPGEMTAEGLIRLPQLLDKHEPALLILCHGGNDFLRKKPLAETQSNIAAMIAIAKERNIGVLLMATPTPSLFLSVPGFYSDLADEFKIAYEGKIIADVESQAALKSDAVHPNAEGYRYIAEQLAKVLRQHGAY